MENPELDAQLEQALVDPSSLGAFVNHFMSSPLLVPMNIDGDTAFPIAKRFDDGPALVVFTGEQHSLQVDLPTANQVVVLNGARVIELADPDHGVLVNPGPQELHLPIGLVAHLRPQIPAELLAPATGAADQRPAAPEPAPGGSLVAAQQVQTTLAGNAHRWLTQGPAFETADFFVAFCGSEHTTRGRVESGGQAVAVPVPDPMVDEFRALRQAAAVPDKGTWIGAELHLTSAGSFSYSFVYDDRLDFGAPDPRVARTDAEPAPGLEAWRSEFIAQGRAERYVPEWAR
ncbi:SseB family protein [Curtobacterium sp. MCBA15_004]|uniref:SseB family protein n=1 Tax=unclassified Curtobacterium TaxID=257496 RepID=UPI0008DD0AFC|nr:SseB family protein [Curtobacterium sp. MCBA15_004]WIA95337.1 SseB family protein [Curtobacterium sp. MCBA15_004]